MLFQYPLLLKKLSNFYILAISITSDINLPLSPICLFVTYVVCCEVCCKSGKTFSSFSERVFVIIFRSTFNKEMGL